MTGRSQSRGFEGDLAALGVVDLVQTLSLCGKTARVVLESSSGTGTMWFREGVMTHATAGPLFGDVAVFDLIEWTTGRFAVEHGLTSECRTIDGDTTQLLLEGLRRFDERSARALPEAAPAEAPRKRKRRRILGFTAGAVVLVAAGFAVAHRTPPTRTTGVMATMISAHEAVGSPVRAEVGTKTGKGSSPPRHGSKRSRTRSFPPD